MKKNFLKLNKACPAKLVLKRSGGFSLLEVMVAILILTIAVTSLFTLIYKSLFAAEYANNQITATYLAQEAIDYVRNDRDTTAFQGKDWNTFLLHYGNSSVPMSDCYASSPSTGAHWGCSFDVTDWAWLPTSTKIQDCNPSIYPITFGASPCPTFFYNDVPPQGGYYTYTSTPVPTSFKRQIFMATSQSGNELDITVKVEWLNGSLAESETLNESLLRWQ